jgi:hypothetical protein
MVAKAHPTNFMAMTTKLVFVGWLPIFFGISMALCPLYFFFSNAGQLLGNQNFG